MKHLFHGGRILLLAAGTLLHGTAIDSRGARPHLQQHFYYVHDTESFRSLEQNAGSISLLSPVWFTVNPQGVLESTLDPRLLDWAGARGLTVMPVLVNKGFEAATAHLILTDAHRREDLIASLLRTAIRRRLQGIQLDFENIPPGDRDAFTRFAEDLAQALHNLGMKFSVAVVSPLGAVPRTAAGTRTYPPSEHSAAFDYFRLGAAADFVTLMAYDQHTAPGEPGPVAGMPWVEACLQKALELLPSAKLMLGIPLYYRSWDDGKVTEGTFSNAQALAAGRGAKVAADAEQGESMFRYEAGGSHHIVWLQDAQTLARRVDLIRRYHLRGFSAWRLGQEDPLAWQAAFAVAPGKK